jgi:hypothetical protein
MKLFTGKAMLIAIGAALALAGSASAQTSLMRVDIPFAFAAGEETLPAGVYSVRLDQPFHRVLLLPANATGTTFVRLRMSTSDRNPSDLDNGKLEFRRYGGHYVLSGVWGTGRLEGWRVAPSRIEQELAKTYGPAETAAIRTLR